MGLRALLPAVPPPCLPAQLTPGHPSTSFTGPTPLPLTTRCHSHWTVSSMTIGTHDLLYLQRPPPNSSPTEDFVQANIPQIPQRNSWEARSAEAATSSLGRKAPVSPLVPSPLGIQACSSLTREGRTRVSRHHLAALKEDMGWASTPALASGVPTPSPPSPQAASELLGLPLLPLPGRSCYNQQVHPLPAFP